MGLQFCLFEKTATHCGVRRSKKQPLCRLKRPLEQIQEAIMSIHLFGIFELVGEMYFFVNARMDCGLVTLGAISQMNAHAKEPYRVKPDPIFNVADCNPI
jgi:hypothetical protein